MGRFAALTTAVLALGAASGNALAQDRTPSKAERGSSAGEVATKVRTILLAIHEDEPISAEILTKRLSDLGSATTRVLLEALESGRVPPGSAAAPTAGRKAEPMHAAREAAAIAALSGRSRGEILQPATAVLKRSTRTRTIAVVVRLFGAVGDRREFPLLCRTVRPTSDEIVDGELTDAFEAAATAILKRDGTASTTVHELLRGESDAVRYSLIRALAAAASEPALAVLAAELRVHPEEDVFVLEQMTQACATIPPPVPESILMSVRPYLSSEQPVRVARAARCLAAMQDFGSVGDFVTLLRRGEPEVVRAAHEALVATTNVGLFPDADRWSRWLEEEGAWFADDFPRLSEELQSGSAVVAAQAISQMAAHPLYRREIAEKMALALEHEPAAIRRIACSALRQLRARTAVPFLLRWAEDPDRELAGEARRALQALQPPGSEVPGSAQASGVAQGVRGSGR